MTKLAIIDLDGVIVDASKRFEQAEAARAFGNDAYWRMALDPNLIPLDTLIPGADVALADLEKDGYTVVYLTSRPENMRQNTRAWMAAHDLVGPPLVMKPHAAQYIKTIVWKNVMVQHLVAWYEPSEVLYVDDEQQHCDAINGLAVELTCKTSLLEQPAEEIDDRESEHPF